MIFVGAFAAETPNKEAPVDNLRGKFGDLHPDAHIAANKHQLKEIFASISQVVVLDEVYHHGGRSGRGCVRNITFSENQNAA